MTNFALIQTGSNYVENIIIRDNEFDISGFTMVKIESGVFCQSGMFLNKADGLFYQDKGFSMIYPSAKEKIIY
ncbi:hypothetical protein [Pantoea ananatis]|uniref:hypothetical protein n=1 Tax=Pantoea ananas TaxID=553 RepID=UPI000496FBD2|nr:hypothetical protein [Pantoea ananatis]